jgi:hypothetical protein
MTISNHMLLRTWYLDHNLFISHTPDELFQTYGSKILDDLPPVSNNFKVRFE